jgi:hypothetical protein
MFGFDKAPKWDGDVSLEISDCSFTANIAKISGGAVRATHANSLTIHQSTFLGNQVQSSAHVNTGVGGAVGSVLRVGGTWAHDPTVTMTACTFLNNEALKGGGFWSTGPALLNVSACMFKNNVAQERQSDTSWTFTNADVGKEVRIKGDYVEIGGQERTVIWRDAKHHDCSGTIKSVEEKYKGKVQLEDGQEFENGASRAVDGRRTDMFRLGYLLKNLVTDGFAKDLTNLSDMA